MSFRGPILPEGKQKESGSGGEGRWGTKLGGVNGWENVAEVYCIREESVFNFK